MAKESVWEKWTGVATVAMAVLTIVLAVGAVWNIVVLKQQLREARDNDARQIRAWIVVAQTSFGIVKDPKQTASRAGGIVTLKNTGNSPALQAEVRRCREVRVSEPDTNVLTGPNCFENQLGIVGRDVPVPMQSFDPNYEVPPAGLAEPAHFYYWGRITYDITPDSTEHVTTFCLHEAGSQLAPCTKGNSAD